LTTKQTIQRLVDDWVRPEIRSLSAYHVPAADGLIKLDAMENPYSWPQELRDLWLQRMRSAEINRYPDPQAAAVKVALRAAMGIPREAELLLGNGSDELIQMIAMTVAGPARAILSVDPGFVMYRMIATFTGLDYIGIPLRPEDFSLDAAALLSAVEAHQPAVTFLAYPNNPTGNLFSEADLLRVVERATGLVVIDEAYAPFTDASMLKFLGRYDNLLVMRTLSKMGLAGLRLGLLAGPGEWLREIDKTRLPYNINVLTQISAEFALEYQELFEQQTRTIRQQRAHLFQRLRRIGGLQVFPSEANFILVRMPAGRAGRIHAELRERGVLVKNLDGAHPSLADCLRITVGTPAENQAFLTALDSTL
jgi:histidinol-phosphate aminotransferase